MSKVIFTQNEMPFPEDYGNGNKITKFRYRIVNSNRNQSSDWSVINYAEQDVLKYEATDGMPRGGTTGQVAAKDTDIDYDVGWYDVVNLIPSNTYAPSTPAGGGSYVSTNSNVILPSGGLTDQVLTKSSNDNYDVEWKSIGSIYNNPSTDIAQEPYPTGGTITQYTDPVSGYTYKVHTFNYTDAVQSFEVTNGVVGQLLLVGGGGGGGGGAQAVGAGSNSGGGGAGGVWYGDYAFGVGTHNLFVGHYGLGGNGAGLGGTGNTGYYGDSSWFDHNTTTNTGGVKVLGGGGGGGSSFNVGGNGIFGGSGGGAGGGRNGSGTGGAATTGYQAPQLSGTFYGNNGNVSNGGGALNTPSGRTFSITGTPVEYARGGSVESGIGTNGLGYGGGGRTGNTLDILNGYRGGDGVIICRYRIA